MIHTLRSPPFKLNMFSLVNLKASSRFLFGLLDNFMSSILFTTIRKDCPLPKSLLTFGSSLYVTIATLAVVSVILKPCTNSFENLFNFSNISSLYLSPWVPDESTNSAISTGLKQSRNTEKKVKQIGGNCFHRDIQHIFASL